MSVQGGLSRETARGDPPAFEYFIPSVFSGLSQETVGSYWGAGRQAGNPGGSCWSRDRPLLPRGLEEASPPSRTARCYHGRRELGTATDTLQHLGECSTTRGRGLAR